MNFPEINARTRPYLSQRDIENKWIWGTCKHVINVSQRKHDEDIVNLIKSHGATYVWIPMAENKDLDINLICKALNILRSYKGEETIVHCDCGNNRSRLVCEFAMFAKTGEWIIDELSSGLDGCINKTSYNIKHGFLPDIDEVENIIKKSII